MANKTVKIAEKGLTEEKVAIFRTDAQKIEAQETGEMTDVVVIKYLWCENHGLWYQ